MKQDDHSGASVAIALWSLSDFATIYLSRVARIMRKEKNLFRLGLAAAQ